MFCFFVLSGDVWMHLPLTFRCQGKPFNFKPTVELKHGPHCSYSNRLIFTNTFLFSSFIYLSIYFALFCRCVFCCSSVAKGSYGCRSGSCHWLSERRKRSYGTWPPWCWLENHARVTSCTGEISRLSTRGEEDPAGSFDSCTGFVFKRSLNWSKNGPFSYFRAYECDSIYSSVSELLVRWWTMAASTWISHHCDCEKEMALCYSLGWGRAF